jgi:hypothetical protein
VSVVSLSNSVQGLHWGQLTVLWAAVSFTWVVIVAVAVTISPDGQASEGTEWFLFTLLVVGVTAMLGVTFTWFGGRKTGHSRNGARKPS